MIKLAIFDLDGVITSTSHEHYQAWKILFKNTFDITLDDAHEVYTKGVSRLDSLNVLLNIHQLVISEEQKHIIAEEKNSIYLRLIEQFDGSHLLPGVKETLTRLKALNIRIALGSASKNGPLILEKLGMTSWFDYIVDPSQHKGKPDPAIFLDAMHHFHLTPHDCIAFEDAQSGIKSIKRAGMFAIGIGEDLHEADIQISHFTDLNEILWERILKPYDQKPT